VEPPFFVVRNALVRCMWGVCPILKTGGVDKSNPANRFSTAIQGGRFFLFTGLSVKTFSVLVCIRGNRYPFAVKPQPKIAS